MDYPMEMPKKFNGGRLQLLQEIIQKEGLDKVLQVLAFMHPSVDIYVTTADFPVPEKYIKEAANGPAIQE
jgi:hypothetical protein